MNKKTKTVKKPNGTKPIVMRSFFAVLPVGTPAEMMSVLLMATSRKLAIKLYENWNDNTFKLTPKLMKMWRLRVYKVQAKNAV